MHIRLTHMAQTLRNINKYHIPSHKLLFLQMRSPLHVSVTERSGEHTHLSHKSYKTVKDLNFVRIIYVQSVFQFGSILNCSKLNIIRIKNQKDHP
jgi:hypothetical protein